MNKKKISLLLAALLTVLPSCADIQTELSSLFNASSNTTNSTSSTATGNSLGSSLFSSSIAEEAIKVEEINLTADEKYKVENKYRIYIEETLSLLVQVLPNNADNKTLEWQVDGNNVYFNQSDYSIRGISAGTSIISASSLDGSNKTSNIEIEVIPDPRVFVESVSIDNRGSINSALEIGDELTLSATALPAHATNNVLEWTSSRSSVLAVDSFGKIRALSAGSATITVSSTDGTNKKDTLNFTITAPSRPIQSVSISAEKQNLSVGQKMTLTASILPVDTTDSKTVSWSSSNPSKISVNQNSGEVTAVAVGSATITVTTAVGNKTDSILLTVDPKLITSVSIVASKTVLSIGEKVTLTAAILPTDTTDSKEVTWSSSDPTIASVNATSGEVTAQAVGSAVITVTTAVGNKTNTVTITINPKPITSVSITASKTTLTVGEKLTLTATILPSDTTDNKAVNWSTSSSAILSVSSGGEIEALAVGSATITVTTVAGAKTATKTFTISAPAAGIVAIDMTLPQSAPSGWTYNGIDNYNTSGARKLAEAGDYILTPLVSMGNSIKITLDMAQNDGGGTGTNSGSIEFGVQGLSQSKTEILNYHYITDPQSLPKTYTKVDFYLNAVGICYIKIIYKTKITGYNIGIKSIVATSNSGGGTPDPDPDPDPTPEIGFYKPTSFSKYLRDIDYVKYGLPDMGASKMLVIPVDFPNAKETNTSKIDDIKKTYYGTDTEWESVKTYYQKSSYNNLNLDITVLDSWQTAPNDTTYYDVTSESTQLTRLEAMFKSILSSLNSTINFADYDSNKDGYIDSVQFIYNQPADYEKVWWAWKYNYFDTTRFDNVRPNFYVWASYEFTKESGYRNESYRYNAHTYIHETAHLMGVDDYYDYTPGVGPENGLGGADMMDWTIGDHNPFTKMTLGWTYPKIVNTTSSAAIELQPFQNDGDFIIVTNNWSSKEMFDEYFILEYYTPTNLHAQDRIYTNSGIRVFHVNASLKTTGNKYFNYDNSDTTYKLIKIIEADGGVDSARMNNSDLFTAGKTITLKYNNGTSISFNIVVNSITSEKAIINFTKK